jgi:hypothetical protein
VTETKPESDDLSSPPDSNLGELAGEKEIRTFVGPRADYYVRKWSPVLNRQSASAGFNAAAFVGSGLWLPYRKMWKATFIFYGILTIENVLEELLFPDVLQQLFSAGLSKLVGLAAAIVCGIGGNRWYLSHTRQAIAALREQGLADDAFNKALEQKGGTSLSVSLGVFSIFVAMNIAIVSAMSAMAHDPDPTELAAEVKPLILKEWQTNRELRGAVIQNVSLVAKGGHVYTGFVDATFAGQPKRLSLEVVFSGDTISWNLKPLRGR